MEEQKNKSKEVKMQPNAGSGEEQKAQKYTYEELTEIANNLFNENRYLKQQLRQADDAFKTFNRLEYLFRIVECDHNNRNNSISFSPEFVEGCVSEIQKLMTPPEEENIEKEGN